MLEINQGYCLTVVSLPMFVLERDTASYILYRELYETLIRHWNLSWFSTAPLSG